MYGWLWRKLPGPWPVRALEALVLFLAVCTFLVTIVFPWVEPKLPFSDNVVDGGVEPTSTAPATPGPATPAPGVVPDPGGGGELPGGEG